MWKDLSMKDKAAIMKVAIKYGITDLDTIRNKFDEGGPKNNSTSSQEPGFFTRLGNLLSYAKNYLVSKLDDSNRGEFINLSDKNVERITNSTDNVETVLTNEFVEGNKNTIRKARDFRETNDTILGDRKIPLSKISTFYGIEDGKLKAGPLELFDDNTTVVPNRAKHVGKIKKILKEIPKDKKYDDNFYQDLDSIASMYNDSLDYSPSFSQYITYAASGFDPRVLSSISTLRANDPKKMQELTDMLYKKNPNKYKDPNARPKRFITEHNDTIPAINLNAAPKVLFANEEGNSAFVSFPYNNLETLNDYLSKHPSYPIMVDNGRYSAYQTSLPNISIYSGLNDANDMFILGTTRK